MSRLGRVPATQTKPIENEDDDEYEDEEQRYSIASGDLFLGGGNRASNSERICSESGRSNALRFSMT